MKRTFITSLIATASIAVSLFTAAPVFADSSFSPASSLADAEASAKQSFNFIAYKGYGRFGKKVSPELRLEKLNRINRELLRVESAFGIELPRVNVVYVTDTSRGFYNDRRDEIVFSSKKLEHTLRHEFGHVIDNRLDVTGREWRDLVNRMKDVHGFSPSNYANTNLIEYWAEAFAYFTAPDYGLNSDRFPAELESFISKVIDQLQSPRLASK